MSLHKRSEQLKVLFQLKSYTKDLFTKKKNSHDLVIINPTNKTNYVIIPEYFLP